MRYTSVFDNETNENTFLVYDENTKVKITYKKGKIIIEEEK